MRSTAIRVVAFLVASTVFLPRPAVNQVVVPSQNAQDAMLVITGTAVSSGRNTLTVRTESGLYIVFVFDHYTNKPRTITPGSSVRIISSPTGESGVRLASDIRVTAPPPETAKPAETGKPAEEAKPAETAKPAEPGKPAEQPSATAPPKAPPEGAQPSAGQTEAKPYETGEAVPVSVRRLESDIERQARRWTMGFRAGFGMDPELLFVGVQARFGPFFTHNLSFRPNVDFLFGEVTKQFAIDLNAVYRLPITARQGRWNAFIGLGPCLCFSHRNFEEAAAGDSGIDFGDFTYNTGLNILTGVDFRSGFFVEAKTTLYATPHLRLGIGYSF